MNETEKITTYNNGRMSIFHPASKVDLDFTIMMRFAEIIGGLKLGPGKGFVLVDLTPSTLHRHVLFTPSTQTIHSMDTCCTLHRHVLYSQWIRTVHSMDTYRTLPLHVLYTPSKFKTLL